MPLIIQGGTSGANADVDATPKALRTILYDANGNPAVVAGNTAVPANQGFQSSAGLDGGKILRAIRVGEHGTQRVTSESLLFHDAFEGSTINTMWTQSLTTQTAVQTTGVLVLNNSNITTLNTDSIITCTRQFPKYPRQPLYARFRALITANVGANHSLVEMGFGAPAGVTQIISNGAFFRWAADGTLKAVLSYNGTEQVTQVLAQGVINTSNYYFYDVIVDDDFARFLVSDANGTPIVDQQIPLSLTVPFTLAVSHIPTFARTYVDTTGGGTAVQLKLSAHTVQMLDAQVSVPWPDQLAGAGRQALINPATYAQNPQLASGAAPAAFTPSNTAGGNAFLGGEALCNATATSENLLSVFAFVVPSPYTFFLTDIFVGVPLNTVAAITTTATTMEWFLIANCATGNISTGGGQRMVIPNSFYTGIVTLAAGLLLSGTPAMYAPRTPIRCDPGTTLHIGYKMITGAATATEVYRTNVAVGGYFQ